VRERLATEFAVGDEELKELAQKSRSVLSLAAKQPRLNVHFAIEKTKWPADQFLGLAVRFRSEVDRLFTELTATESV
jgi:hypothetical protein